MGRHQWNIIKPALGLMNIHKDSNWFEAYGIPWWIYLKSPCGDYNILTHPLWFLLKAQTCHWRREYWQRRNARAATVLAVLRLNGCSAEGNGAFWRLVGVLVGRFCQVVDTVKLHTYIYIHTYIYLQFLCKDSSNNVYIYIHIILSSSLHTTRLD